MNFENITFTVEAGIARLTLNRPDKLNSFTGEMHAELRTALDAVQADKSIRVLVLTGAGRAFCAGQDLADPDMAKVDGKMPDIGNVVERNYKPLVLRLQNLRVPTIAAVNGIAAGAGASVALACDLVVASKSASFLQAFSKIGLIPDTGGTWFLPQRVGMARAMGLALLADKLPAEKAAEWGLIWECPRMPTLPPASMRWPAAVDPADQGPGAYPPGHARRAGPHPGAATVLRRRLHARAGLEPGLRRRRPGLHGKARAEFHRGMSVSQSPLPRRRRRRRHRRHGRRHRPGGGPAGHVVKLLDNRPGAAAKAVAGIRAQFAKLAEKGKISAEAAQAAGERLVAVEQLADLADAALVVEAIVESLEAKQKLYADLEAIVGADCIFGTNTSSISVTAIGAALQRPERLAGLHFFNPAPLMALVEIVSGLATDKAVADTLFATAAAWGKTPVHARRRPASSSIASPARTTPRPCASPRKAPPTRHHRRRCARPAASAWGRSS
jgi:2-(1,2-epoxy-1,2-dihydrophenyl)acetyl-CoA isomerase